MSNKAYILSIGNEVLSGAVINTNASIIAQELSKIGIEVEKVITISDDVDSITFALTEFKNSDSLVLISTGGLGPTHDDITKEVFAEFLNLKLLKNETAKTDMTNYIGKVMNDSNYKQILQPEGSIVIPNKLGTADGFIVSKEDKIYISLVGPTFEMEPMLKATVLPYLMKFGKKRIVYQYTVCGRSESSMENDIALIIKDYPRVSLCPYCANGKIRYVLSSEVEYKADLEIVKAKYEEIAGSNIASFNGLEVETELVNTLKELGLKISFAESITGGMLAGLVTSVSGASDVISESYVTYSNDVKHKLLGVSYETISKFDVVSIEVAKEMVQGLFDKTGSSVCVAISGYAGPSGRDVGKVCFVIKYNETIKTYEEHFRGNRQMIRERAARTVLFETLRMIRNER